MKFTLRTDEKGLLKKKTFDIEVDKSLDIEDQFEEAFNYLEANRFEYFFILDCFYFFEIKKGKKFIRCSYEGKYCYKCGGDLEIYSNGEVHSL